MPTSIRFFTALKLLCNVEGVWVWVWEHAWSCRGKGGFSFFSFQGSRSSWIDCRVKALNTTSQKTSAQWLVLIYFCSASIAQ